MKAAVLHAPHEPLTIEEVAVEKPGPRGVAAHRLCRAVPQRFALPRGLYPIATPSCSAMRASAIVEAVGEGVAMSSRATT